MVVVKFCLVVKTEGRMFWREVLRQESACPVCRLLRRKQMDNTSHQDVRRVTMKMELLSIQHPSESIPLKHQQMQWQVMLERMEGQWTDLLNLCHSCKKIKTRWG